jgi:Rps23 Pro-64 3,4-dihydroxylase Tpa1-like proline 4-hydroxylase
METAFRLGRAIDVAAARAAFARDGRAEIAGFLDPECAEALRRHLLGRDDWKLVINAGDSVYEMPRAAAAALSEEQRREMEARVVEAARHGFHFRYEAVRVSDDPAERAARDSALDRFVAFLSSVEVLGLLRDISGIADLDFADGQATAYSAGHYLTRHDDDVAGKQRRAAYVLGLTPQWRPEWGGLLMFHRPDGHVEEAFVPAMGALRLFAVPVSHSVSYVTPMAPEPRLSVTGWLRHR